ncbi:RNA polymerase II-associated protein [Mycena kentingensis (nom. inval.)]|nr:RNA polymerase II-associated protein [Mycena kentingensis (nom. inval.)]
MDGLSNGRTIDIELGGQEVITIDLDVLDQVDEVLDLLSDPQCQARAWVWTVVATEFWRRGSLEDAEKVAQTAVDVFTSNNNQSALGPIYSLMANIKLAHASKAPKMVLQEARQDVMRDAKTKNAFHSEAAVCLNKASSAHGETKGYLFYLTHAIQQLAGRQMNDALSAFNTILDNKPTNLIALLGRGRILFAQRNYTDALKTFRRVLELNPKCLPDPRIGIGLCFWALGHKAKAKSAWQRSLDVNPDEYAAQVLLGLESINASKSESILESERAALYTTGSQLIGRAFKINKNNAAAANALCELFLMKGETTRAMKLAEHAIQFADTLTLLTEAYIRAGRVAHLEGALTQATRYYTSATEGQPKHVMGSIGLAQVQMQNDEMAAAIHTLDTLLQPPLPQSPHLEATVILASLRAFPRPGVSSADVAKERTKARELFDRVTKELDSQESRTTGYTQSARAIATDMDMYTEIARLWQGENLDRVSRALGTALRISENEGVDPRLLNNLGALKHLDNHLEEARVQYEAALTRVTELLMGEEDEDGRNEAMSTSILYNLARVYEDEGREAFSRDAYEKLLARHPEYVDAKIRQAHVYIAQNRQNEAHDLIKQALSSQNSNLNVRAFYTYFLVQANQLKLAKEFVFSTLKDHDKHDIYSLCAAGWIQYHQARENRDTGGKAADERRRGGLAIVTAEDALGALSRGPQHVASGGSEEAHRRLKNAREALDVFGKVRESLSDGSVYLNMGHCYYACDEFDRAIESYETASTRFYGGHNISVLLCLCRSWYAKATKDQSFVSMNTALRYAQNALHILPNDKAVIYNIAMIQQKSVEMMFALPTTKRTLKDLKRSIEHANNAQKLFASLAADRASALPYSRDIADQRKKYGDIMLRKSEEHLAAQKAHESEIQAKMDTARQRRQEERERLDTLEREKMEEEKRAAEKLAEVRKIAREEALAWTAQMGGDSDDEKEKKPRRTKKAKAEPGSGDEGAPEPKKKRRGKLRKAGEENGGEEGAGMFSEEEDVERPRKRAKKQRVVKDEDEEDAAPTTNSRKKQFKSKEVLSDTDDEMPVDHAILSRRGATRALPPGGFHPTHLDDTFSDGRYTVVNKLGDGTRSTVWLVSDSRSSSYAALKIVASWRESSGGLAVLKHLSETYNGEEEGSRHVARMLDHFMHEGPNGKHLCIVSDVQGTHIVADKLYRFFDEGDDEVMSADGQIALGVAYLHERGIAHGDLHATNILFSFPSPWTSMDEIERDLGTPERLYYTKKTSPHLPIYRPCNCDSLEC